MPLSRARHYRVLALLAAFASGPALAAPPTQHSPQPIRHEINGSGSGDFNLVLKRYKVPREIREIALRSFAMDAKFSRRLPKNSFFQVIYESNPSPTADERPREVLRSIWVNAGGTLFDLYRYGWRGVTP